MFTLKENIKPFPVEHLFLDGHIQVLAIYDLFVQLLVLGLLALTLTQMKE